MLLLALSCLQGRTQSEAFAELARLPVDGIQLTPGNLPSLDFRALAQSYRGQLRYHHSFSWQHYRAEVYDAAGRTPKLPRDWSIHPPPTKHPVAFATWLDGALAVDALCEVMYPGFLLGQDAQLLDAMASGLRLAVDISHLHIQRARGDLQDGTFTKLLAYERIEEVHVSHNLGRADSHLPLQATTPWLDWARERMRGGVPLVFESRMHERQSLWESQLELLQ
ncbi:MAG TPA: hypothetical protein VLC09_12675 [Polyangiaceae bacterium]|nr:hypothetical protein [Polyangiaceae bacterium]